MFTLDLLAKKEYATVETVLAEAEKAAKAGQGLMATKRAKGNANLDRLLQLIGSQMYAGNLADVSVKELIQNSFDAVRASVAEGLEAEGRIDVLIDPTNRLIAIRDNGRGMTPATIRNAFLTLAGTEKAGLAKGETAGGGFGMAKAAFLLGNERIWVNTQRGGTNSTFSVNSEDIFSKGFPIEETPVGKTDHGTVIIVKVPDKIMVNGEEKYVWFPSNASAIEFFKKPLLDSRVAISFNRSFRLDPEVIINPNADIWERGSFVPMGKYADMSGFTQHTTATFSWGQADIFIGTSRHKESYLAQHYVLSSGVYQFEHAFNIKGWEKIPYDIYINVRPSVKADSPTYPFDIKREGWKANVKDDIGLLSDYLKRVASGREAEGVVDTFRNMRALPRIDMDISGNVDLDSFIRQRPQNKPPEEMPDIPIPVGIDISNGKVTGRYEDGTTETMVDRESEKNYSSGMETTVDAPKISDFLLDIGIDADLPVLHNNTNIDYSSVDPLADVFFAEMGSAMLAVRDKIGELSQSTSLWGYDILNRSVVKDKMPYFVGVSIDKQYHGVNIIVPMQGSFINPLAVKGQTLPSIVKGLYDTMVHEFTHIVHRDHGTDFVSEFHELDSRLAADGFDIEMRVQLARILKKYEGLFNDLRDKYNESTTKNSAKSIHEGEGGGVADAGANARRTGERQRNATDASNAVEGREGFDSGERLRKDAISSGKIQDRAGFPTGGSDITIGEWLADTTTPTDILRKEIPEFNRWWKKHEAGLKAQGIENPNVPQQWQLLDDNKDFPAAGPQIECT
jgi:hypothetical protein